MAKKELKRTRGEVMCTSPPQESIAILIRNMSDIDTIKEVFGDVLLGKNPVTSRDPQAMRDLLILRNTPVRDCFIFVESTKLKEEILKKSTNTVYQDLLKTANGIVGKNISSHYSLHTSSLFPEIHQERGQGAHHSPCLNSTLGLLH